MWATNDQVVWGVVLMAELARAPARVPARVECALALMQQLVISGILTDDEIRRRVVRPALVDVVHFGGPAKWLSHRLLDDQDMLKNASVGSSTVMCRCADHRIPMDHRSAAAPMRVAFPNLWQMMALRKAMGLTANDPTAWTRPLRQPCRLPAAAFTEFDGGH